MIIKEGWKQIRKGEYQKAREILQQAHRIHQQHPIWHSVTHLSLAATYPGSPKKIIRELFLGICAPYATQRENRRKNHTKKRRKKK